MTAADHAVRQNMQNFKWVLLWMWLPAIGFCETFNCPEFVTASSAKIVDIPAPWEAFYQPDRLNLIGAGLSDGPPSDGADLRPASAKDKAGLKIVRWTFEGSYPKGQWLSCKYDSDLISLTRQLPPGLSECEAVYKNRKADSPKLMAITCK